MSEDFIDDFQRMLGVEPKAEGDKTPSTEEADASSIGAEPEHGELARRAIEAAESNPNQYMLDALRGKQERDRALLELLHPREDEDS
jgi:hypothetical protein